MKYRNRITESDAFAEYEEHNYQDQSLAEAGVAAASLGVAIFQTGLPVLTSGSFRTTSAPASYTHQKSPRKAINRLRLNFKLSASHPRLFMSNPSFWFKLQFDYNGVDILASSITPDIPLFAVF